MLRRFFSMLARQQPNDLPAAYHLLKAEQTAVGSSAGIYAKVIVNSKKFTVTANDTIHTQRLPESCVGDIIQLEKCYEVGTRSFTLRNEAFLDPAAVKVTATVVAHCRGQKVHRKIVKRRKIQYPSKNQKPLMSILRIRAICIGE